MQLSRRIALNGAQLDELDERILISEVYEMPTDRSSTTADVYDGTLDSMGSRVTGRQRKSKKVRCKFRIRLKKPYMDARAEILDKVNGWAMDGGTLKIGARPDQKMAVRCQQEVEVGDLRDWTREYTLIFEANEKPYWENVTADTAKSRTAATGSASLEVGGTLPNVLDLEISNESGKKIDHIKVTAGKYKFEFNELGMAAGEKLIVDHTEKQEIRIRLRSSAGVYRSVLASRTVKSDDELRVKPGAVTVSYEADRAVVLTAKCCGRSA